MNKNKFFPVISLLLGSVFIGLSPIFVRLSEMGPASVGFFRLFLSLPFLGLWLIFQKRDPFKWKNIIPKEKKHAILVFGGLFFAFDIGLWNLSLHYTSVANSSLFNNFAAFFVPLIAWIVYAAKPKLSFMFGVGVALVGAFLLVGGGLSIHFTIGDLLAILSSIAFASYIITMAKLRQWAVSTKEVLLWKGLFCSVFLALFAWFMGENLFPPNPHEWMLMFLTAILIQICGQGLLIYSLGKLHPNIAAITLLAAPVTSVGIAWVVFSEKMTYVKILGAFLILSSILVIQLKEKKKIGKPSM